MEEELEEQEEYIWIEFLVPLHFLSNIKICFSKNNLARIKDGRYAINLNDKKSKGRPRVSLYIDRNTALYFDSLELNIFFKKYFYPIAFTEHILPGTILLDYANIFSRNEYKKNNKIIQQI